MSASPTTPSRQNPRLVVNFPFTSDQQTAVSRLVDQVPLDIFGMRVDTGAVRAMEVVTHDQATAEQDLTAVIEASRPVAAQQMWLAWYYPTFGGARAYGGVVEVHDCSVQPVAGVQNVAQHMGNEGGISTLQARLQAKIDTCPAAPTTPPVESSTAAKVPGNAVIPVAVPDLRNQIAEGVRPPAPTRSAQAPCLGQPSCITAAPGRVTSTGGGPRPSFPTPRPLLPGSGLPAINLPLPAAGLPFFPPPPPPTVNADPSANSSGRAGTTSPRSSAGGSARASDD